MTVEWNRTVTEVVWESQTAPGITWTTVVGGTGGTEIPARRLLPNTVGTPGQTVVVNEAGTAVEYVDDGAALSDDDPAALGVADPGTSDDASRSDHVHPMPTAADVGALDDGAVRSIASGYAADAQAAAISAAASDATTKADAKVADAINDGTTTVAPSQNAVFDGLALKQPLDADLTAIAALAPSDDALIQRKAGAWTSRTPAQVKADMSIGVGDVSGFDEQVRDVVGTALVAGSNVTITVNDGSDTITIASTGGGGGSSDPSVVVLGPALLTSAFGTPVTGDTIGERMAAWVIADATTVMLGADLASHVPSSWRAFDVYLRAFQVTAVSTPANIAVSFSSAQITDASIAAGTAVPVESGTFTWDEGAHANQLCPILAQNVPCEWHVGTAVAVLPIPGSSQPVRFRFPRGLAGDTLNAGTFGVFGVVLRQVDGTDDPTATTELAPVVAALDAATTDQSILVISDSTAEWDAPARDWPRRLARRINRAWPAWSTRARLYNETSHAWDSYMTPAGSIAGTSARMFTVHNASVGGWATTNWTSELNTMATGVTPNAIFIALGFNDSATAGTFNTNMTALVNAVQAQWPGVPLVLIAQPKDQGGSGQTTRRTEIISIATAEDIGWIDVWTEFTPYSTTTGHYSDNQHQTQLGSEVIAGRVFGAFCG